MSDIRRSCDFLPFAVNPGIHRKTLRTLADSRDCLLEDDTVYPALFRQGDDEIFAVLDLYICVNVIVEQSLRAFRTFEKVNAIGLTDAPACLFEGLQVFLRETSLIVRRQIQKKDGIASD